MVELVDTQDLKSCGPWAVWVQVPLRVQKVFLLGKTFLSYNHMYTVYAIASTHRKFVYVGLTSDLQKRILRHNNGFEKTTKPYAPFILIYFESALDRPAARIKEKKLKGRSGKRFLYNIIAHNFKELSFYFD